MFRVFRLLPRCLLYTWFESTFQNLCGVSTAAVFDAETWAKTSKEAAADGERASERLLRRARRMERRSGAAGDASMPGRAGAPAWPSAGANEEPSADAGITTNSSRNLMIRTEPGCDGRALLREARFWIQDLNTLCNGLVLIQAPLKLELLGLQSEVPSRVDAENCAKKLLLSLWEIERHRGRLWAGVLKPRAKALRRRGLAARGRRWNGGELRPPCDEDGGADEDLGPHVLRVVFDVFLRWALRGLTEEVSAATQKDLVEAVSEWEINIGTSAGGGRHSQSISDVKEELLGFQADVLMSDRKACQSAARLLVAIATRPLETLSARDSVCAPPTAGEPPPRLWGQPPFPEPFRTEPRSAREAAEADAAADLAAERSRAEKIWEQFFSDTRTPEEDVYPSSGSLQQREPSTEPVYALLQSMKLSFLYDAGLAVKDVEGNWAWAGGSPEPPAGAGAQQLSSEGPRHSVHAVHDDDTVEDHEHVLDVGAEPGCGSTGTLRDAVERYVVLSVLGYHTALALGARCPAVEELMRERAAMQAQAPVEYRKLTAEESDLSTLFGDVLWRGKALVDLGSSADKEKTSNAGDAMFSSSVDDSRPPPTHNSTSTSTDTSLGKQFPASADSAEADAVYFFAHFRATHEFFSDDECGPSLAPGAASSPIHQTLLDERFGYGFDMTPYHRDRIVDRFQRMVEAAGYLDASIPAEPAVSGTGGGAKKAQRPHEVSDNVVDKDEIMRSVEGDEDGESAAVSSKREFLHHLLEIIEKHKLAYVGAGTGWLIRIGPVSDRFQTGFRPVSPCHPCHRVIDVLTVSCHVGCTTVRVTMSCHMHSHVELCTVSCPRMRSVISDWHLS